MPVKCYYLRFKGLHINPNWFRKSFSHFLSLPWCDSFSGEGFIILSVDRVAAKCQGMSVRIPLCDCEKVIINTGINNPLCHKLICTVQCSCSHSLFVRVPSLDFATLPVFIGCHIFAWLGHFAAFPPKELIEFWLLTLKGIAFVLTTKRSTEMPWSYCFLEYILWLITSPRALTQHSDSSNFRHWLK